MGKIKRKLYNLAGKIVSAMPNDTSQTSVAGGTEIKYDNPEMSSLCRRAAAEGIVMLKNNGALPLSKRDTVSVFSRMQYDWFYTGYGSGGDVNPPYCTDLISGLRNYGVKLNSDLLGIYSEYIKKHPADKGVWAHWPTNLEEMTVTEKTAREAAGKSNKAIIVIGRSSGEDMENRLEAGSWYLTKKEISMIDAVTSAFREVILLINTSNIIDMSVISSYGDKISSVLYVWQGGMESGNAVASVLTGESSPCGKLTDTIAADYGAYPSSSAFGNRDFNNYTEDIYVGYRYFETFSEARSKVLYPFGFGLGYTTFSVENISCEENDGIIRVRYTVKNTGNTSGREVVQLYFEAPQGKLGKPARQLAGFSKTSILLPGGSEGGEILLKTADMASYDDVESFSYILEKGTYRLYLGTDVRSAYVCYEYTVEEDTVTENLSQCAAPVHPFSRMKNNGGSVSYKNVPVSAVSLRDKIVSSLPEFAVSTPGEDAEYTLEDVKKGRISLDEFVLTLSNDELEAISRGDYTMNSPLGAPGNAGAFGGVLESLRNKGVPPVIFTDGPSGVRIGNIASLIPSGTCLACSFDPGLVENLFSQIGKEMTSLGSMVIAAPGMNIHRNPLCGRNFEYFSEDPYLTGIIAAAAIRGVQSEGVSACPKHYACNNQEKNRTHNDSRVSERALREIYLRGFEIAVKTSSPDVIMTSYNKINGVWGHYHYELVHDILRGEWKFRGCVVTDWWMRSGVSPEFPGIRDQAYRVRSGVNVLMPGGQRTGKKVPDGTLLESLGKDGGITIAEIRRNAREILTFALKYV